MNCRFSLIFALFLLPLVGCQSGPTPSAGMSAIRINVIAEPKAGVKDSSSLVTMYDTSAKEHGAFERVDYSALDEIVVWIEPTAKSAGGANAPATIDVNAQKPTENLAAAVSVGQTLVVHNAGSTARNFYSVSDGNEFDLGAVAAGGRAQYVVKSEGLIEVLAAGAKEPVARVYSAPSRWVKLTQSGTTVDFVDLPPGNYKVVSWHPRLPGTQSPVTLAPNQSGKASIKVGVNALPKVGPR
jgi:hypothetical protein